MQISPHSSAFPATGTIAPPPAAPATGPARPFSSAWQDNASPVSDVTPAPSDGPAAPVSRQVGVADTRAAVLRKLFDADADGTMAAPEIAALAHSALSAAGASGPRAEQPRPDVAPGATPAPGAATDPARLAQSLYAVLDRLAGRAPDANG